MAMLFPLHLVLAGLGTLISAFNLDTSNSIRKTGEPGSLFGFSLAMHWQLSPQEKRLLLVGAPRTKAFPAQKANVTGGLFVCDLTPQQTCTRVRFDDSVDLTSESKENQWMGVSVQSQGPGGKIVTCAHRYEKRLYVNTKQESRDIFGRCYILSQDFTIGDDGMDGGEWSFCEGRLRGHEKFGSCQQGVAATFTRDYHYVVFGAPGAHNWKGMVRVEHKNSTVDEINNFEDDGPYEVGGENQHDGNRIPVPANSYLGFSLDTGTGITSLKEMTFVAGAPRANHSGAVLLLKKDKNSRRTLSPEYILEGEGLASSFGYDIAVVDLNSDGWQDIVVGAPQYFDRDGEIGGAVYIYINKDGKWDNIQPVRLNGTKESMFGLSVKNIGDINQDGFPDIAVGAPYDEMGKVYIYHGSQSGINTKPTQIIDGSKIHNAPFFGYSVAGNMDLDKNFYPDIAVGSLSDTVYIFRSRPVVTIMKSIIITPNKLDLNKKNCDAPSGICMEAQACFQYEAKPPGYNPGLNIVYNFVAESERRRLGLPSRVQFTDRPTDHQYSGTLRLGRQNEQKCTNSIKLQLQENIKDKLRPIPITVGVEIKDSSRRNKRQVGELLPILNSNKPSTVTSEMQFLKEGCGDDNICNSNLKLEYKFCTRNSPSEKFSYLQIEKGTPVLVLKDQKEIALEITIANNPSDPLSPKKDGDDAHEAKLIASFPNTLSYSSYRELRGYPEKQLMCAANQNGSQAECELGNPFKRNSNVTFYLILSTTEISVDTTDLDILLKMETTSSQPNLGTIVAKAKVVVELLLSVSGIAKPSQVYFSGTIRGESAMKSEEDVGSLIEYEFRVNNLGRPLKALGTASLDIQWPKEISNGKWLLYLMNIDSKGLDKVACQPSDELNRLQLRESHHSRKKRAVEAKSDNGKSFSFFQERKYLKIECNSHAKCVTIKCPLQGLDSNAVLMVRSRLWNSTFLEEYSKLNYLDILVNATINVDSAAKNIKVPNAGTQVRVTVFPEKTVALHTGVPWWIILVAILAGILMLALLVFFLWKCGFFRRSNKDQYDATYHKAEIHAQPSDKERLTSDA